MKDVQKRSECPVSKALDVFGDKWTLLIIRDIVFKGFRFYNEFLETGEGIATNVLSDRLKKLVQSGFLESKKYELQKTKKVYRLTELGIDLIPVLVELLVWGFKYDDTLDLPKEKISVFEKIWEDKEAFIAEITASVRKYDATNYC